MGQHGPRVLGTPAAQHPGVGSKAASSPVGYGTAIPISWVWVDPPALTQLPRLQMARGEQWPEDTCEAVPAHTCTWEALSAQASS